MLETVIAIENLSKRYLLGRQARQGSRSPTLRDVIVREARGLPGNYFITIALHESVGRVFDCRDAVLQCSIEDAGTIFSKYHQDGHITGVVMRCRSYGLAPRQFLPKEQQTEDSNRPSLCVTRLKEHS